MRASERHSALPHSVSKTAWSASGVSVSARRWITTAARQHDRRASRRDHRRAALDLDANRRAALHIWPVKPGSKARIASASGRRLLVGSLRRRHRPVGLTPSAGETIDLAAVLDEGDGASGIASRDRRTPEASDPACRHGRPWRRRTALDGADGAGGGEPWPCRDRASGDLAALAFTRHRYSSSSSRASLRRAQERIDALPSSKDSSRRAEFWRIAQVYAVATSPRRTCDGVERGKQGVGAFAASGMTKAWQP